MRPPSSGLSLLIAAPATAPPTPPITAPCSFLLPGRLLHPPMTERPPAPRMLTSPTDPAAATVAIARLIMVTPLLNHPGRSEPVSSSAPHIAGVPPSCPTHADFQPHTRCAPR